MGLLKYIVRRLLKLVLTLIVLLLVIFALIQMLPINRRAMLFIEDIKQSEDIQKIIEKYGLNRPVYEQFITWLGQVLRGNLGWSEIASEPVLPAIMRRLPATLELVLYSVPIILFLGMFLGVISARHQGKPIDHASRTMTMIGWALPSFWLGIVLIAVFYGGLGWFPPGRYGNEVLLFIAAPNTPWRWYTCFMTIDSLINGQTWIFIDALRHLALPVTVLAISNIVIIVRVMRSSTLETLKRRYIAVTKVKGSTQNEVIMKNIRSNTLVSASTFLGLLFASMVTTIIVTETVFNFPGVGIFAASAAIRLDIATVIGLLFLFSFVFVIVNLIADIGYAYVETRIR